MSRLPSYRYLVQQIGGQVVLFEDGSEREIVRFDPEDQDAASRAQKTIYDSELSPEDKCYAHFWCGYFYAHAGGASELISGEDMADLLRELGKAMADHSIVLTGPAWAAYDKLRKQMVGGIPQ